MHGHRFFTKLSESKEDKIIWQNAIKAENKKIQDAVNKYMQVHDEEIRNMLAQEGVVPSEMDAALINKKLELQEKMLKRRDEIYKKLLLEHTLNDEENQGDEKTVIVNTARPQQTG